MLRVDRNHPQRLRSGSSLSQGKRMEGLGARNHGCFGLSDTTTVALSFWTLRDSEGNFLGQRLLEAAHRSDKTAGPGYAV